MTYIDPNSTVFKAGCKIGGFLRKMLIGGAVETAALYLKEYINSDIPTSNTPRSINNIKGE